VNIVEKPSVFASEDLQFLGITSCLFDKNPTVGSVQHLCQLVDSVSDMDIVVGGCFHLMVEEVIPGLLEGEGLQKVLDLLIIAGRQLFPRVPVYFVDTLLKVVLEDQKSRERRYVEVVDNAFSEVAEVAQLSDRMCTSNRRK